MLYSPLSALYALGALDVPKAFFCQFLGSVCKAISYAVGFVSRKRFSTEAQIGLSYTAEKGFFDSTFFDWEFRLADPVRKLDFFDWMVEKLSRKSFTPDFEPIASLIPPQSTHPHAHTPISGTTQQYHITAPTLPLLSLLLLFAASQRGALRSPAACITRQQ